MTFLQFAERSNVLIPLLLPAVSLYFFSMPTRLDFALLPLLLVCFALNYKNILINLSGVRLFFLMLVLFAAIVGLFNEEKPQSIMRDMISLVPLFLVPFGAKSYYSQLVKMIFIASFVSTIFQVAMVAKYGGRAHFVYINSMIPFCNILFFYAVYFFSVRKSYLLSAFVIIVCILGVISTGSKVNVLVLMVSAASLLLLDEVRRIGIALVVVFFAAGVGVYALLGDELIVVQRVIAVLSGDDASTSSRIEEFRLGLKMFEGREILGSGLGSSIQIYGRDIQYFHLSPLYFFFKFGVLSAIFYSFVIYLAFKVFLYSRDLNLWYKFRLSAIAGFVTLFVYMLVFPSYKYVHMNILLGFYLSFLAHSRRRVE